jgi:hypothetical protein
MTVQGVTCAKKEAILPATVIVVPIRAEDVDAIWHDVAPLVRLSQRRIERNAGMADIYDDLIAGRAMLWTIKSEDKLRAVVLTEIAQHPRRRVWRILHIGGSGMSEWLDQGIEAMKRAARIAGCEAIEADGRLGWAKIVPQRGFREVSRLYEMEI